MVAVVVFVTVLCARRARRRRAAREYHSVVLGVGLDEMGAAPDPQTEQQDNTALMNALFFLRGHPEYELKHPLRRVGTRRGKYFFLLNERRAGGRVAEDAAVLELVEQGADGAFAVSAEGVALAHLFGAMGRAHPNVAAPRVAEVIPATNVLAVVRAWERRGSLRDALRAGCDPQQPARAKYAAQRGTPLPVRTVARLGRDILEALLFFQQLGYPCYHLHAGNVLVDAALRRAAVTDYENNVLGVAPRHAAVVRALATRARVAPDVACFACVLAEMASGAELTSLQAADVLLSPTSACPAPVRAVLTSILAPFATAPPDVRDLLRLDFFADAAPPSPVPRLSVELPVAVQQLLVSASDALAASVCNSGSSSSSSSAAPIPVKSPRPYSSGAGGSTGTSPHHTKHIHSSTAGSATASTGLDSTHQEQQERLGETTSLLNSGGGDQ